MRNIFYLNACDLASKIVLWIPWVIRLFDDRVNLYSQLEELKSITDKRTLLYNYYERTDDSEDAIAYLVCKSYFITRNRGNEFIKHENVILTTKLLIPGVLQNLNDAISEEKIKFDTLTDNQWEIYNDSIISVLTRHCRNINWPVVKEDFFIIPFEHAYKLVSNRSCVISNGNCFVYKNQMLDVLLTLNTIVLEKDVKNYKAKETVESQNEMDKLIEAMEWLSVKPTEESNKRKRNLFEEGLSRLDQGQDSFPPCVQAILEFMKTQPHIKYEARKTLGIYLSNIYDPVHAVTIVQGLFKMLAKQHYDNFMFNFNYMIKKKYTMMSCKNLANVKVLGGCTIGKVACESKLRESHQISQPFYSPVQYTKLVQQKNNSNDIEEPKKMKLDDKFMNFIQ